MVVWLIFNGFVLLLLLLVMIGCNTSGRKTMFRKENLTEAERRKRFTPAERAQEQIVNELSEHSRNKKENREKNNTNSSKSKSKARKSEMGKSSNRRVKRANHVKMASTRPSEKTHPRRSRLHDLLEEHAQGNKSTPRNYSAKSSKKSTKTSDPNEDRSAEKKFMKSGIVRRKNDNGARDHEFMKDLATKESSMKSLSRAMKNKNPEKDGISTKVKARKKNDIGAQHREHMIAASMKTFKSSKKKVTVRRKDEIGAVDRSVSRK
ncbi:unnamed protein product, partial [Mesorhabditis belari]|uniref:Uncharacterized protein n=1 Tax=Mesorhabditis belari TaxID=2138241 RepID=A0AAF3ETW9_9BILA